MPNTIVYLYYIHVVSFNSQIYHAFNICKNKISQIKEVLFLLHDTINLKS